MTSRALVSASAAAAAAVFRSARRLPLLALLACVPLAQAQSADAPVTRAQVKMERAEFLRTHRWHEPTQSWLLRDGVEPPAGVKTRAAVKAERDAFLRVHRWDERVSGWVPIAGEPREPSGLTRVEVKRDTVQFLRTHVWDEASDSYVLRSAPRGKR